MRVFRQDVREVHDVPKLADVAWPAVLRERLERLIAEALGSSLGLDQVLQERLRQQPDVFTAALCSGARSIWKTFNR